MEENTPYRKGLVKDGDTSEKFGYEAVKKLLTKNKIDGIFSANEPITIGILKAIKELDIKPDEIKIVSFDEPNIPPFLNYPVTLIKQPRYEIGKIAAQILLERIKEKRRNLKTPFKKILLEPEMIKEKAEACEESAMFFGGNRRIRHVRQKACRICHLQWRTLWRKKERVYIN